MTKAAINRIIGLNEYWRVFKYSDESYKIKFILGREIDQVVAIDAYVVEVAAAFRGDLRATCTSLYGHYGSSRLAQMAGDCAAAATELEDTMRRTEPKESQEIVTCRAQMVFAWPVLYGAYKFLR